MKKIGQRNVVLPAALLDLPVKISALCKNEGKLVDIVNQKYKLLTKDIKVQIDLLLSELRKMKTGSPALRIQIELIEGFLAQLDQFILFPRIVEVPKIVEKIVEVEKDRIVHLPRQDDRSLKMELSLSLLVEKLIL